MNSANFVPRTPLPPSLSSSHGYAIMRAFVFAKLVEITNGGGIFENLESEGRTMIVGRIFLGGRGRKERGEGKMEVEVYRRSTDVNAKSAREN